VAYLSSGHHQYNYLMRGSTVKLMFAELTAVFLVSLHRNAYKILVEVPERKRILGRPKRR
jgi:hypothetical protein